ncbi:hypothetical protein DL771_009511 [Monosporascus sp. 5C6A]|nr:hypothetical protein DL771_009511 [Monosporascus sp. 5C6A]
MEDAKTNGDERAPQAASDTDTFWVVILGLNSGMLLTALDFNIVATAVPIISSEFQDYSNSQWLGTAFLITFALIQPIFFILGSALCGWSSNMDMLIWSRAVQGIGAGGIYGQTNGGNAWPWRSGHVIGTMVGGGVMLVLFIAAERFAKFPLVDLSMFKGRTLIAIFGAEFFYGMVLLGSMYYPPQFFQLVFGDTATLSGVGLLPMMLGLMVGNPAAGFITSKKGISLLNAIVGAALQVPGLGLTTRWTAETTRAEAIIVPFFMGIGQGAIMSGLLLSAQVAVKPAQIGVVTGLCIFVQCVGNTFGIALFATVYVNRLSESLAQLGLEAQEVAHVLADVQAIRSLFSPDVVERIVDVYANNMRNGWWLLFAASCMCFICACLGKQHKFQDHAEAAGDRPAASGEKKESV